jgi:ATP-dependent DNA ligase
VLLGVDGVSDFDGLHTRKHDAEVQLYAFDCLALDGEDLRKLPLSLRKTNLARLLARRPDSWRPSSRVKSDRICSARLVSLVSRGWFPNIGTAPIVAGDRRTGLR